MKQIFTLFLLCLTTFTVASAQNRRLSNEDIRVFIQKTLPKLTQAAKY